VTPVLPPASRWTAALPDLLALGYSLVLAWLLKWEVKDLVWGLWLSSFVVGYLTILLTIFGPMIHLAKSGAGSRVAGVAVLGGLFMLAFFTVHFGMFHVVHSVFLNVFFPVEANGPRGFPGMTAYGQVLISYWPFVLGAAVSERANLRVALRTQNFMGPYKNVVRMHLLIFFFAGAAAIKLDSFLIYSVVLCVYFFPFNAFFGKRKPAMDSDSIPAAKS
jgi:hypothetical protein